MAEHKVDDQTGEEFSDPDLRRSNGHIEELTKKVDALERERDGLVNEIAGRKDDIKKLTLEIDALRKDESKMREKMEGLEREVERSQEAAKAAGAIGSRTADLETEVTRLHHDSISETSAAEEARRESAKLRSVLEEKESLVLDLEWEVEGLKQAKAENKKKARDLEKKIGVLEMKEIEEKSKKIRIEEELREEFDEKEKEIRGLGHKIEELQRRGSELEKWMKEKLNLEEALRESEEKARIMESNILKLQEKVKEAENVMRTVKENAAEAVNGAVNGIESEAKGLNVLKLQWHVVAGSTGAIAVAAAVIYVWYGKRS